MATRREAEIDCRGVGGKRWERYTPGEEEGGRRVEEIVGERVEERKEGRKVRR